MHPSWQPVRPAFLQLPALLLAGLLACTSAWSQDEQLADLTNQLEYAFYTADSRALQQSLQRLMQLEVPVAAATLRQQQVDYGRWKLAQLLSRDNATLAQQAAQECTASKLNGESSNSQAAIHAALQAACLNMLEQLRPVRGVLYKREREAALNQALKLGSQLPQVQLVVAWLHATNQEQQEVVSLKRLLAAYDAAALNADADNLLWGHAEACYLLGKAEMAGGDLLAARNALERALVLAPDYRMAQSLLRELLVK